MTMHHIRPLADNPHVQDLEQMYHEIEEARDTLFKSDHEFSCESEDEDEKVGDRLTD